jgi:hypothetical protein
MSCSCSCRATLEWQGEPLWIRAPFALGTKMQELASPFNISKSTSNSAYVMGGSFPSLQAYASNDILVSCFRPSVTKLHSHSYCRGKLDRPSSSSRLQDWNFGAQSIFYREIKLHIPNEIIQETPKLSRGAH